MRAHYVVGVLRGKGGDKTCRDDVPFPDDLYGLVRRFNKKKKKDLPLRELMEFTHGER